MCSVDQSRLQIPAYQLFHVVQGLQGVQSVHTLHPAQHGSVIKLLVSAMCVSLCA